MKSLVKKYWQKEKGDVPLYQQIAKFISTAINNGDLPQNYSLPGHRQLAAMFGVGIQTILHALHILHQSQLVKLSERSRTVVSKKPVDSPDWDAFLGCSAYDPTNRNFFSVIANKQTGLNLSMGLDKSYYFRGMFNQILKHASLPVNMEVHPFGLPPLRQRLCEEMTRYGIQASPSQVMMVTSITHALNVLFLALLGRKATLLVASPCHLQISKLVKATGSAVAEIPMDDQGIVPHKLVRAVEKHRQPILCIAPDCSVPTGTITSGRRREEILDICTNTGTPIIEHTIFPLGCTLSDLPSLKSMDTNQVVVHVSQIGVNASTNPWMGWIIAEEYLLQRLNTLRFNYDAHQNYLVQMSLLKVMQYDMYNDFLQRIERVREERQAAVGGLLEKYLSPYATWNRQNMDACVWLKLDKAISVYKMYEAAVDIIFQPGWFYDDKFSEYLFISPFAVSVENLEIGLKAMVGLIKRQGH